MSLLQDKIEIEIEEAEIGLSKKLGTVSPIVKWFLIVGIIAVIPCYYTAKAWSHGYWRKDWQNFMVMAKPSFTQAQPPQVSTTTLFSLGGNTYGAVAPVNNPNLDLFLPATNYSFNFYDANNKLMASSAGTLFLLPNQQSYIVASKLTLAAMPASANVQFTPPLNWQKRLDVPQVNLIANATNFYNQINPITFAVEGNVVNESPYSLGSVELTFLLYDASGNLVGVSSRTENTLVPYEQRAFKQLWPDFYTSSVAKVKIVATTNTLDPNNINLPANLTSPASNLGRPSPTGN